MGYRGSSSNQDSRRDGSDAFTSIVNRSSQACSRESRVNSARLLIIYDAQYERHLGQRSEYIWDVMILLRQELNAIRGYINLTQNEHNERLSRNENIISYPDREVSAPKMEQAISETVPAPLIPPQLQLYLQQ